MFDNVMTDIETYSLDSSNALMLSFALVPFNLLAAGPEIGSPIMVIPSMAQQVALGREIDPATVKFWNDQTPEARAHWHDGNYAREIKDDFGAVIGREKPWRLDLNELGAVGHMLGTIMNPGYTLWANGIVFDVANLESLMRQGGVKKPWAYNAVADYRTQIRKNPMVLRGSAPPNNNGHDPVDDCLYQIAKLWQYIPETEFTLKPITPVPPKVVEAPE